MIELCFAVLGRFCVQTLPKVTLGPDLEPWVQLTGESRAAFRDCVILVSSAHLLLVPTLRSVDPLHAHWCRCMDRVIQSFFSLSTAPNGRGNRHSDIVSPSFIKSIVTTAPETAMYSNVTSP